MTARRMDVILVIDSLGSGGAQRQLCELAAGLRVRGLNVVVVAYHPADFYVAYLKQRNVDFLIPAKPLGKPGRLLFVCKCIFSLKPRVVCCYLSRPGFMATLPRWLLFPRFRLVVSERHYETRCGWRQRLRFLMHAFSDKVVVNSASQTAFISKNAPWLKRKLVTIRNMVDLQQFRPEKTPSRPGACRFLVIAKYAPNKNPEHLLRGFKAFVDRISGEAPSLAWYGKRYRRDGLAVGDEVYNDTAHLVSRLGLGGLVELHDETTAPEFLYRAADALCLASYSEAMPNVICEAMASGLPVLASRIGDIPQMVIHGLNGFLFDPADPESIGEAFCQFHALTAAEKAEMSANNRKRAAGLFGSDAFIDAYLQTFAIDAAG